MKRIIVSVSNDLVTDQRITKICHTLRELEYEILLVGRKNRSKHKIDRDYKTKRLRLLFNKGFLFYTELNFRLFFLLLFSKKDLLYSNDLDTLLPNFLVSKIQRKELIFDSHELFTEIPELENRKFVKSIWFGLEKRLLPRLKKIITVSPSIKKHYENLYNIHVDVIRNLPIHEKIESHQFPFSTKNKKVVLYQGSVNIGRGIELMIDAIKLLDNYILVIAGSGDIIDEIEEKVLNENLENKVKFLGRVLPKELKGLTPNADVGISLEEDLGLNYRYSLPNKVFDYIHAEIPVIVSDLPEMKKLVQTYQVGEILSNRTPDSLAKLIMEVVDHNYNSYLLKAKKDLNWSNEKTKLVHLLKA